MQVKHSGAGVVAIDRFLDLIVHADRNIVRVGRRPLRTIGRHLNHQFFLVFREQAVIKEMHRNFSVLSYRY
ncbi:hypothetical protein D3C79_1084670 [compost metagenome]